MSVGRPSKFAPEVVQQVLAKVEKGVFLKVAAKVAGVSAKTIYAWLHRGERTGESDKPFRDFRDAYMVAQAKGRLALEESALGAGRVDGRQALEVLARRWPKDWGSERGEIRQLRKANEEMRKQLQEILSLLSGGKASDG